jgi:putative transposase
VWIDRKVGQYPLSSFCGVLSVSLNGYLAWKRDGTPGRTRLTDTRLLAMFRTVHAELKGAYGSPRVTEEIRERGLSASK